jgi:hypothetical protein
LDKKAGLKIATLTFVVSLLAACTPTVAQSDGGTSSLGPADAPIEIPSQSIGVSCYEGEGSLAISFLNVSNQDFEIAFGDSREFGLYLSEEPADSSPKPTLSRNGWIGFTPEVTEPGKLGQIITSMGLDDTIGALRFQSLIVTYNDNPLAVLDFGYRSDYCG